MITLDNYIPSLHLNFFRQFRELYIRDLVNNRKFIDFVNRNESMFETQVIQKIRNAKRKI